jgi:hypothetical protein
MNHRNHQFQESNGIIQLVPDYHNELYQQLNLGSVGRQQGDRFARQVNVRFWMFAQRWPGQIDNRTTSKGVEMPS